MYRHSPVRNQRSKGIKIKHVLQVCLLIAVCFWLIFQVKRSHDKKKEFEANNNNPKISLNTHADEIVKFGRKDLQPKLEESTTGTELQEDTQEQDDDDENKHEEEEQDEDKIEEGGGGDDEIDENEQEKSNMEIERDEVDIVDEDKEIADKEIEDKETEEGDGDESQTGTTVDHDEDGTTSTEHTHEAREEHYKADDASSAVITQDPENVIKNGTLDVNSSENVDFVDNSTIIQEKDSASMNATLTLDGPPANTTSISTGSQSDSNAAVTETTQEFTNSTQDDSETLKSNDEEDSYDQSKSENLETNNEDSRDPTHLEEKEVRNDLETLPEIETEDGNTAAE